MKLSVSRKRKGEGSTNGGERDLTMSCVLKNGKNEGGKSVKSDHGHYHAKTD